MKTMLTTEELQCAVPDGRTNAYLYWDQSDLGDQGWALEWWEQGARRVIDLAADQDANLIDLAESVWGVVAQHCTRLLVRHPRVGLPRPVLSYDGHESSPAHRGGGKLPRDDVRFYWIGEIPTTMRARHSPLCAGPNATRMAAQTLGRKGGAAKTLAQAAAARENGKKGGRPRSSDYNDPAK